MNRAMTVEELVKVLTELRQPEAKVQVHLILKTDGGEYMETNLKVLRARSKHGVVELEGRE